MYSHTGTWDFLKLFLVVLSIVGVGAYIHVYLGHVFVFVIAGILLAVLLLFAGMSLSQQNSAAILEQVTKFSANDAQIDKHRMQAIRALTSGNVEQEKADAKIRVLQERLNYGELSHRQKQQQKLLEQKEKAMMEIEAQEQADEFWATEIDGEFQEVR